MQNSCCVRRAAAGSRRQTSFAFIPGAKYTAVAEAPAGTVCAVTGLSHTYAGEALGCQPPAQAPVLEPVLTYRVLFPEEQDVHTALQKLRTLEEEDPQLRVSWNAQLGEVHMRVMGEVQLEVLARLAQQRFGLALQFDEGGILYKETIASPVEGMGHFEPLRHYAEVHLLLEPAARGSGLHFSSACSEDMLDKNWQRLILTHLAEKVHAGVLTGAPITDMNITLVAGRAHSKHTRGGRFSPGHLPRPAPGPAQHGKHPAGALLCFPAGGSGRVAGARHGGCAAHEWQLRAAAAVRRNGCAYRHGPRGHHARLCA